MAWSEWLLDFWISGLPGFTGVLLIMAFGVEYTIREALHNEKQFVFDRFWFE
jgi:hypothetical protein